MNCAGCNKEIGVGDKYIEDTASGFMGEEADPGVDEIISEILGGVGGRVFYCEDCTAPGGDYLFETFYGEEEENE